MIPKEKAEELVGKFSPLVTTWDCYYDEPTADEFVLKDAKQCALIAVDEIIRTGPMTISKAPIEFSDDKGPIRKLVDNTSYWQEVKQEIEKLSKPKTISNLKETLQIRNAALARLVDPEKYYVVDYLAANQSPIGKNELGSFCLIGKELNETQILNLFINDKL